jgi:aspartyl/asparaginyl beta-hydroxylase (cupin superfamily)
MNQGNSLELADEAFQSGNNERGLQLLREHNQSTKADAGSFYRQAVVEEQIGDWGAAGRAFYRCIVLAPHVPLSYLYAGYWLEKSEMIAAAAAMYSLAQEADPDLFFKAPDHPNPQTLQRILSGKALFQSYLTKHHKSQYQDDPDTLRIKNAIWPQTHSESFHYARQKFAPNMFYIPDLGHQAYYKTNEFEWVNAIETASSEIASELNNALEHTDRELLRPYLGSEFKAPAELKHLTGSSDWSALDLFKNGEANPDAKDLFPKTLNALRAIPSYSLNDNPFEVFFSLLKPHQHIADHYGESNHALTVHLALDIPDDCYLEVNAEQREWSSGKITVFDDSFLHSAHNNSDKLRSVLIFSVWHPDLTLNEQTAIQTSFHERQNWMLNRRHKIEQLLS